MTRLDMGVKMYYALAAVAHKYEISIGEVNITLTRWAAEQLLGFKCDHEHKNLVFTKKHRIYCKQCYTFMEKQTVIKGLKSQIIFTPKKSFIDLMKEEASRQGVKWVDLR